MSSWLLEGASFNTAEEHKDAWGVGFARDPRRRQAARQALKRCLGYEALARYERAPEGTGRAQSRTTLRSRIISASTEAGVGQTSSADRKGVFGAGRNFPIIGGLQGLSLCCIGLGWGGPGCLVCMNLST